MLQGRLHDRTSEEDNPDLLLMVTDSPRELTLQVTQYRRLRLQTMGTEDENMEIHIEDGEVLEDPGKEIIPEDSSQQHASTT